MIAKRIIAVDVVGHRRVSTAQVETIDGSFRAETVIFGGDPRGLHISGPSRKPVYGDEESARGGHASVVAELRRPLPEYR